GFFLGQRSARFDASSSNALPVLARPFFDVNSGTERVELVAFPGILNGRITVEAPSSLWGLEANYRCKLCCDCNYRVDLLAGPRHLNLQESITISELVNGLQPVNVATLDNQQLVLPAGTVLQVFDRFATRNQFYGGQVGAEARWYRGRLSLDLIGKVALGVTQ